MALARHGVDVLALPAERSGQAGEHRDGSSTGASEAFVGLLRRPRRHGRIRLASPARARTFLTGPAVVSLPRGPQPPTC
eukprot:1870263-Pyramimonas_sp.AAC.1